MIEILLILIIFVAFAIRTSAFQTWLAQQVAGYYSKELNTEIRIDKVDILFIDRVEVKGIYIEDQRQDTLLFAESIVANVGDWDIAEKFFYLDDIALHNARVNLKTYEGDTTMNFQFLADYFASEDTTKSDFDFRIHQITLDQVNFSMRDENQPGGGEAMNFSDLYLHDLEGQLSNFYIEEDHIYISLNKLATTERSGFELYNLSGDVTVSPQKIGIAKLEIKTPETYLQGRFAFLTNSFEDYGDFLNKVRFDTELNHSRVQMSDVAYFVPMFLGYDELVRIDAVVTGPINDMLIQGLDLKLKEKTHFHGEVKLPDFSNIKTSDLALSIDTLVTHMDEVAAFQVPPYDEYHTIALSKELMTLGEVNVNGAIEGKINDLGVFVEVSSDVGDVVTNAYLKYKKDIEDYNYYGKVVTNDLALNHLLGLDQCGTLTASVNFNGTSFEPDKMDVQFKGSAIQKLQLYGYTYNDIELVKGRYRNKTFKGQLNYSDPNLAFDFDGFMDFRRKMPKFDLKLHLERAKLAKLNLIEKDSSTNVHGMFEVSIDGNNINNIYGDVNIDSLRYTENDTLYDIGNISFHRSETLDTIRLRSKIVDADIKGEINVVDLSKSFVNLSRKAVPNFFEDTTLAEDIKRENFSFDIRLKDLSIPVEYLNLPLDMAQDAQIKGFYKSEEETFNLVYATNYLNYDGLQADSLKVRMSEVDGNITATVKADYFRLNDSLKFNNPFVRGNVNNNLFEASVRWDEGAYLKDGKIGVNGMIEGPESYEVFTDQSYFYLRNEKWEITPDAAFLVDSSRIEVKNFSVHHQSKEISANGVVSSKDREKLYFGVNGIMLEDFNSLLGGSYVLKGRMNGEGYVADLYDQMKIQSELEVNDLIINGYTVGDVKVSQYYQPEEKRILLVGEIQNEKTKTLGLKGAYDLAKLKDNLSISLVFNNTDIAFLNAFLPEEQISNIRGILSGNLEIKGEPTAPELDGELDFMAGNVKVGLLNANFGYGGKIKVQKDMIIMDYVPIYDENGNVGHLNASLLHSNFTNWNFDVTLDLEQGVDRFLVMNTNYEDGAAYYGSAYVTGIVGVSGTQDLMYIDADVTPRKGTVINLPMAGVEEYEEDGFLTFVNIDSTLIQKQDSSSFEGIVMNIDAHVTPDALFRLIFDESTGDVIQGRAEGDVSLKIDKYGELKMFGGATLTDGNYQFTMTNLFSKKFEVVPGSDINWTGSPYEADIDINAVYKLQAPLYDLMLGRLPEDQLSMYNRPEKVRCEIELSGSLADMQTSFDFSVPNADETAKAVVSKVKSDEEQRNKQFFSLLLLNKFIAPPGMQGSNAGVSAGAAATADFVSNQLSSVLSQVSEDYDIGVKYATDDFSSNNEIEVGLSTQLLNDRLRISGSVGVANTKDGGASSSNFIGDFAIDYNINEKGTFVLSVFNESNEFEVTNNLAGNYTQGVGVSYREEFNSFEDFVFVQYILDIFRDEHKDKVPDNTVPVPEEGKEEEFIYENFIKNR